MPQGRFVSLSAGGWARRRAQVLLCPPAGPHAYPRCPPAPPGVPSGGAVQRAQTHGAEALQRVPRAAQAGEAAPTSHRARPSLRPAPVQAL